MSSFVFRVLSGPATAAIALLVGLTLITVAAWRRYQRLRPRRIALGELLLLREAYAREEISAARYLNESNALLKRLWVHVLHRPEVGPLTGDAWLAYLDGASGTNEFTNGPGAALGHTRFAPNVTEVDPQLHHLIEQLLTRTDMRTGHHRS